MSFRRHGEIYRSDKKAVRSLPGRPRHCTSRPPQPHRLDEFPAGYSLAGCSPAEPASASPAGWHLAGRRLRSTIKFQRTANSVLTVCLSPGDNPRVVLPRKRVPIRYQPKVGLPPAPKAVSTYPSDAMLWATLATVSVVTGATEASYSEFVSFAHSYEKI